MVHSRGGQRLPRPLPRLALRQGPWWGASNERWWRQSHHMPDQSAECRRVVPGGAASEGNFGQEETVWAAQNPEVYDLGAGSASVTPWSVLIVSFWNKSRHPAAAFQSTRSCARARHVPQACRRGVGHTHCSSGFPGARPACARQACRRGALRPHAPGAFLPDSRRAPSGTCATVLRPKGVNSTARNWAQRHL